MAKKKPIISPLGQWAYPGEVTIIPSSKITMKGVNYPVLGVDDFGNSKVMMPGAEYEFPGNYVTEYPQMGKGGEMIKRKDGSYSKRGLWDNIRANKGSGKKPTKQMLEQERKIKAKMQDGGWLNNYSKSKVILPSVSQPELNPIAMTGLMKSKIAYADAFNNPTGARLTNRDSKSYTFTSDDEYNGGAPQGSQGNVYMSSYGEYATPQIQDVNGKLQFIADPWSPENVQRSLNQSIIFNEPDEAQYFGEHYKEVAPMMQSWNKKYQNGGALNKTVTCSNCGWSWKLAEGGSDPLTCHKCGGTAKLQNGGWLQEYQTAGEVVQKPISEYKKQFDDEVKDLPSWYERNRARIKSTVPSEYLQSPDRPFYFPEMHPTFNGEDNPSPSAQGVPNYYKALYEKGLDHRINISNKPENTEISKVENDPSTIMSHEIGHYLNQNNPEVFLHNRIKLAEAGINKTYGYQNFYTNGDFGKEDISDERKSNEFISDAYALKQDMRNKGYYDYTKGEKLTPEIWEKYKQNHGNTFNAQRFNKVFKHEADVLEIPTQIFTWSDSFKDPKHFTTETELGNALTYLPKKDSPLYLKDKEFWDKKEENLKHYPDYIKNNRRKAFYAAETEDLRPDLTRKPSPKIKSKFQDNITFPSENWFDENVNNKSKDLTEQWKETSRANPLYKSSDEKMINFLNEIVKNNSNTNNYTAKYGGWLDSYKVGGSTTEDKPIIPIPPIQPTSKNKISFWDRMEYEKNPSNPNEYIKVNRNPEYYKFNSELDKAGDSEIQAYQNYLNENFNTFLKEDGVWNEDTKKAYDKYVISNENPQDLNKNKFKINSKQPLEFQYNDKGSLQVKATDAQFDPELKDWVDLKKLNPTLEEFKSIVDKLPSYNKYYENIYDADKSTRGLQQGPVDSQRAAEIKSSKQYQNLDPKYKEYLGKTFGTLPIVEKTGIYEGYSPSRMWTTPPGSKSKPWLGDDEVYDPAKDLRYLYFVTPKEGSVWAQDKYQKELENLSCLTGNCGNEYLNKGNSMFNVPTLNLPKKKNEKQIPFPTGDTWRLGQQAYAEILNNPAIVKYAKEKGIDLTDIGKDQFSPILAEALIGQRDANFNKKGVVIPHSRQYVPVIQDPNEFNLAGYLPITADMFSANMNPNEKNQVLLNWDEKSKAEYFRKAGIPEDQWDNVYIHTSPFPISDYNASTKKYGGWLGKYQVAGEVSTEQNPEVMNPIEIQTKKDPWYERYPRMAWRPIDKKLHDFGSQYAQRISDATGGADWYKQSNPFMNLALEAINAPQLATTYAVTGKVQTPSEAMDIQNPYGAMAVDMLLDPTNLIGLGLTKPVQGAIKKGLGTAKKIAKNSLETFDNKLNAQIFKNPKLSLFLQNGQPIKSLDNIIYNPGLQMGNVKSFKDFITTGKTGKKDISELDFFKGLDEGAASLDNSLKKRVSDLESPEGFNRLVNQEKEYLIKNGTDASVAERVAKLNAKARVDELKNTTNINREATKYAKNNFLGGTDNKFVKNKSLYNNAYFDRSYNNTIEDKIMDKINLQKPVENYSKPKPGGIGMGYNYVNDVPTEMHEIAHGLQRGRVLPIDDELRKITPKEKLSGNFKNQYDYFKKGSNGKEPSAFANELRESMYQKGFIPDYYSPISEQQVQDAYRYFKKNPIGVYDKNTGYFSGNTRIFDFMKPTKTNSKLLTDILNKLPAVAPVGLGIGASQLQKQKNGGQTSWLNKYK
jgi:hypothetical protein